MRTWLEEKASRAGGETVTLCFTMEWRSADDPSSIQNIEWLLDHEWLLWSPSIPYPKGAHVTASFIPQPYPLFAIPLDVAQDPARFEVTGDPIRLVLGWTTGEDGERLPVLDGGGPAGTPWAGPVLYEETRERAAAAVGEVKRATRASVRDGRMLALFARWEAWSNKLNERVEQRLDRLGPS